MATLQSLVEKADEMAGANGHKMRWESWFNGTTRSVKDGKCEKCGKSGQIDTYLSDAIGGPVMKEKCGVKVLATTTPDNKGRVISEELFTEIADLLSQSHCLIPSGNSQLRGRISAAYGKLCQIQK